MLLLLKHAALHNTCLLSMQDILHNAASLLWGKEVSAAAEAKNVLVIAKTRSIMILCRVVLAANATRLVVVAVIVPSHHGLHPT